MVSAPIVTSATYWPRGSRDPRRSEIKAPSPANRWNRAGEGPLVRRPEEDTQQTVAWESCRPPLGLGGLGERGWDARGWAKEVWTQVIPGDGAFGDALDSRASFQRHLHPASEPVRNGALGDIQGLRESGLCGGFEVGAQFHAQDISATVADVNSQAQTDAGSESVRAECAKNGVVL